MGLELSEALIRENMPEYLPRPQVRSISISGVGVKPLQSPGSHHTPAPSLLPPSVLQREPPCPHHHSQSVSTLVTLHTGVTLSHDTVTLLHHDHQVTLHLLPLLLLSSPQQSGQISQILNP